MIDGYAEGPVPEEMYRDVIGAAGPALARARDYEERVVRLINEIGMFAVGTAVLNRLNETTFPDDAGILIVPNESKQVSGDDVHSMRSITPADGYSRGSPLPGGRSADPSRPSAKGTGRGTSAKVVFDPGAKSSCGVIGSSREVLFHELTHALRALSGTMVFRPMPNYDHFEEFVAVTLTNMLLSEQGHPLRDGHNCQVMGRTLEQFNSDYARYLKQILADKQNTGLFRELAKLSANKVPWNPLREKAK